MSIAAIFGLPGPWALRFDSAIMTRMLSGSVWAGYVMQTHTTGIILWTRPTNERRRYSATLSLIGWAQKQNGPCHMTVKVHENTFRIIESYFHQHPMEIEAKRRRKQTSTRRLNVFVMQFISITSIFEIGCRLIYDQILRSQHFTKTIFFKNIMSSTISLVHWNKKQMFSTSFSLFGVTMAM